MHRALPVDVAPQPSRLLGLWIAAVASVSAGVVLTLPFDRWLLGCGVLAIAAWAAYAIRRLAKRRHRDAVRLLRLDGNLGVQAVTSGARIVRGRVLPATYVGARMTTLVWRAQGERIARVECLLPDSLPPEPARRLRVQLRYGRSEDSDGAPASHA